MKRILVALSLAVVSMISQVTDGVAAPTRAECDAADVQIRKSYAMRDMNPKQKAEAQRDLDRATAVIKECRSREIEVGTIESRQTAAEKAKTEAERAARVQAERQAAMSAAAAECERRGQPRIGMSPDQLSETCWHDPIHIVKRTTASGVEELNYVYGNGRSLRITNGMVSEIMQAR